MARLLSTSRTRVADEPTSTTDDGRSFLVRKALFAAGIAVAWYVLARRRRSGGSAGVTGSLREKAGDALPGDASRIPIGDTGTGRKVADEPTFGIGVTRTEVEARRASGGRDADAGRRTGAGSAEGSSTNGGARGVADTEDRSTTDSGVERAVREVGDDDADGDEERT